MQAIQIGTEAIKVIDIQAINDGDFVQFKSPLGTLTEIGIYKGELVGLPDYHEVWVNGSPAASRIVHMSKFIGHEAATHLGRGRVA